MLLTGFNVKYFTSVQSGTFSFQNIQTNAIEVLSGTTWSGREMRIGLTGITGQSSWSFSLKNGKMYDPEGRWFGAFNENDLINISGNFSTTQYDYYLNNELICAVGAKSPITYNGWYSQSVSGASGNCEKVNICEAPFGLFLDFQSGFRLGGIWSGSFYHSGCGPVTIRSGELVYPDSVNFNITGTGLGFNGGDNTVYTGAYRTIQLAHTGVTDRTGIYQVGVRVYTDFGPYTFLVSGSGVPISQGHIGNDFSPNSGWNITASGLGYSGQKTWAFVSSYTDFAGNDLAKPIYAQLSYLSGYTGNLNLVTGVNVNNGGANYTSEPYVYITPTGADWAFPYASGRGLIDGVAQIVTGVEWIQSGIYSGGAGLVVVINGGGGSSAQMFPLNSGYIKSFTGQLSLETGYLGSGNANCNEIFNLISGSVSMPSTENVLNMTINYDGTPDNLPLKYLILASGLPDTTTNISLFSGTGLTYKI